jgi:hypothetical protein
MNIDVFLSLFQSDGVGSGAPVARMQTPRYPAPTLGRFPPQCSANRTFTPSPLRRKAKHCRGRDGRNPKS